MKPVVDLNGQTETVRAAVTVYLTKDGLVKLQTLTPNEITNIGLLTKGISMLTNGVSLEKQEPSVADTLKI